MEIYAITRGNHLCGLTVSKERAERLKSIYGGQVQDFESGGRAEERTVRVRSKPKNRTKAGRTAIRTLSAVTVLMCLLLAWAVNDLSSIKARETNEIPTGGPVVQTVPEPKEILLAVQSAEPVAVTEPTTAEQEAQEMPWANSMQCKVTFYDCCVKCCGNTKGITYTGVRAVPHETCAVDPETIPLGSEVFIDYGDGELHRYRAVDTGSAIKGGRIDVCVATHQEALQLGVKQATVYWNERVFWE